MTGFDQQKRGITFARIAIAHALGKGDSGMEQVARRFYGQESLPARLAAAGGLDMLAMSKAAVAAGAAVSGSWAQLLVDTDGAAAEFFGLVRERSVLGRIAGLRRVPLRTKIIGMSSGFSAAWVAEGKGVPVSKGIFTGPLALPSLKVSALTVATEELLKRGDAAAETLIRDDMANALAAAINAAFLDPDNSGVTDIEPASVTNGVPAIAATGDGLEDLRKLVAAFPGDLERAVLVGSGNSFAELHDPLALPKLGVKGGEALGIPAIAVTAAGDTVALIDPDGIAYGADDTVVGTTSEASIEMVDDPDGDVGTVGAGTATSVVSLWQTDSVAFMCDQVVNWATARPSVSILQGIAQS